MRKYHVKNQRKLLTKELRKEIIERDNYTCQICGKYMPDEVGLHIDHIVPIAKGGKTVKSNLQGLCSKCNGKKSSKTPSVDDYGTLE
ncbi:MAG: HNH endonuclease [Clostridia bacterium]|nr:HNH endonuclease [Clostridia bacterium]